MDVATAGLVGMPTPTLTPSVDAVGIGAFQQAVATFVGEAARPVPGPPASLRPLAPSVASGTTGLTMPAGTLTIVSADADFTAPAAASTLQAARGVAVPAQIDGTGITESALPELPAGIRDPDVGPVPVPAPVLVAPAMLLPADRLPTGGSRTRAAAPTADSAPATPVELPVPVSVAPAAPTTERVALLARGETAALVAVLSPAATTDPVARAGGARRPAAATDEPRPATPPVRRKTAIAAAPAADDDHAAPPMTALQVVAVPVPMPAPVPVPVTVPVQVPVPVPGPVPVATGRGERNLTEMPTKPDQPGLARPPAAEPSTAAAFVTTVSFDASDAGRPAAPAAAPAIAARTPGPETIAQPLRAPVPVAADSVQVLAVVESERRALPPARVQPVTVTDDAPLEPLGPVAPTPVAGAVSADRPAVHALPAPVAAHGVPLPYRPAHFATDTGAAIARHIANSGDPLTLRIDPPEFGRVDVRMSYEDGGMLRAVVGSDNAAVLTLLSRDVGDLVRAVSDAGISADQRSFRFEANAGDGNPARMSGDGGSQPRDQRQPQGRAPDSRGRPDDNDPAIFRPLRWRGQIDVAA